MQIVNLTVAKVISQTRSCFLYIEMRSVSDRCADCAKLPRSKGNSAQVAAFFTSSYVGSGLSVRFPHPLLIWNAQYPLSSKSWTPSTPIRTNTANNKYCKWAAHALRRIPESAKNEQNANISPICGNFFFLLIPLNKTQSCLTVNFS